MPWGLPLLPRWMGLRGAADVEIAKAAFLMDGGTPLAAANACKMDEDRTRWMMSPWTS